MSEHNLRRAADRMADAIRQAKADIGFVACDNACDDAPCELLRALAGWEYQVALPPPEPYLDPSEPVCLQEDVAWAHREIERRRAARLTQPDSPPAAEGGQE